jgi:hypothetical protein
MDGAQGLVWDNGLIMSDKCFLVPIFHKGETTMKLHLLFIIMDLLTLAAIPFVYLLRKLRQRQSKNSLFE